MSVVKIAETFKDPVRWAKAFFNWTAKKFQEEILRCTNNKMVLRVGRRGGKTESIILYILWRCFVFPKQSIIVLAPRDSHVESIFLRMFEIINKNEHYRESIARKTSGPYRIFLTNGSKILLFTAGSKTGGEGDAIRSWGCDVLVLDEADRLRDADITSALALLMEDRESGIPVKLIVASTPTGRRSHFYNWCTQPKKYGFVHYHVPCPKALPNWNDEMEAQMRALYPGFAYEQEVLAEFGEETFGYFSPADIDRAKEAWDQDYSSTRAPTFGYLWVPHYAATRTLGVDWDKYQAGPQMVMLERGKKADEQGLYQVAYKVILRTEIPIQKYSLTNGVNKVISLNKDFDPKHIYVDRGYGEKQVEDLHLHGTKHPDSGLLSKVRGISFSETTLVSDPATKESRKERIKAVMANALLMAFEKGNIILSPHDSELLDQLLNYRVVRITPDGMPVFSDQNEHSVDALMLAHWAMAEKIDQFYKPKNRSVWATGAAMGSKRDVIETVKQVKESSDETLEKPERGEVRTGSARGADTFAWASRSRLSTSLGKYKRSMF